MNVQVIDNNAMDKDDEEETTIAVSYFFKENHKHGDYRVLLPQIRETKYALCDIDKIHRDDLIQLFKSHGFDYSTPTAFLPSDSHARRWRW